MELGVGMGAALGVENYWVLTQRGDVSHEGDLQVETPELGMQQCIRMPG